MVRILRYFPGNAAFLRPGGPGPTSVMTGTTEPRHDAAVGRSFLKLGTGEAIARMIAFGVTVLLAWRLGPDLYGTIALATAILLYLNCITDLGMEMLGVSDVARDHSQIPILLPSILGARLVVAAVLIAILVALGLLILPQPDGALLAAYSFMLLPVALGTQWAHLGLQQTGTVGLVRIASEALTALLVVILIQGPEDVAGAPVAQIVGQAAGVFVLLQVLPNGVARLRTGIRASVVASVVRRSWPLVVHAMLGIAIFNSDFLFLRVFRDSATVGYYAVAYTLVSFFLNLGMSYSLGLLPVMARLRESPAEERRLYDTAIAQVFACTLPVAIGGCLLAGALIQVLFGPAYVRSALPLQILVWSIPIALFRNVAQVVLVSHGRQALMLRTVAWSAASNILLNTAMIPFLGMVGAALATVLTESIRTAMVLRHSGRVGLRFTSLRRFWRALVAGALMAGVLVLAGEVPWWAAVVLGALAYGAALALFGGLRFRRGALPDLTV